MIIGLGGVVMEMFVMVIGCELDPYSISLGGIPLFHSL